MSEYHVCGVLLMSRPEHSAKVEQALRAMPGVELHANQGGRMVVTVEGTEYGHCADMITELATLDGVASSSLVYHQIDNESMPEESLQ
ncbi:MAG: chaperone NapD [Chromatiaceae bacterium]|jgi:nitrate reductase NapD|nr:chaperone NapD [Chromatiaceae bacterium]